MLIFQLLVDEIHILGTDRGPTLEVLIARLKTLQASGATAPRIIGVSATIPNAGDVAEWVGVKSGFLKVFDSSYRPVQVETHVLGYSPRQNEFLFDNSLGY